MVFRQSIVSFNRKLCLGVLNTGRVDTSAFDLATAAPEMVDLLARFTEAISLKSLT